MPGSQQVSGIFLSPYKGFGGTIEDAMHISYGHAVIGNGDVVLLRLAEPVKELPVRHHATAALNDQRVVFNRTGKAIEPGYIIKLKFLSGEVGEPPGNFHPADVIT